MDELEEQTMRFMATAKKRPELTALNTTFSTNAREMFVNVDRGKAELLDVAVNDVYDTLQTMIGSQYVNQFAYQNRLWQVILQADADYRQDPAAFNTMYVRSRTGAMVPLRALISYQYQASPDIVTRFNAYPAVQITGNNAAGYSSGQAIKAMQQVADEVLPPGYKIAWSGEAYEQLKSRQHGRLCVCLCADYGLPDSGSALRKVVPTVQRDVRCSVCAVWCAGCGVTARPGK